MPKNQQKVKPTVLKKRGRKIDRKLIQKITFFWDFSQCLNYLTLRELDFFLKSLKSGYLKSIALKSGYFKL